MMPQYFGSNSSCIKQRVCNSWANRLRTDSRAAAHSTYPKGRLLCITDSLVIKQTFVLRINFSGKNPALRVAAKPELQPFNTSQ